MFYCATWRYICKIREFFTWKTNRKLIKFVFKINAVEADIIIKGSNYHRGNHDTNTERNSIRWALRHFSLNKTLRRSCFAETFKLSADFAGFHQSHGTSKAKHNIAMAAQGDGSDPKYKLSQLLHPELLSMEDIRRILKDVSFCALI